MEHGECAEQQVDAFISVLKRRYGLDDSDIHELVNTFVRLRKRSEFAEKMGEWTAKTVISLLLAAFFSGVGWAVFHFVDHVSKLKS